MAVPGVAPPIAYHEQYLVDGGVLDNLPTDILQQLERGTIIASNVSTAGGIQAPGAGLDAPDPEALLRRHGIAGAPRLGEILMRSATLTSATAMEHAAAAADIYVRMPADDIGMFEWKRLGELVERGYEHALEQLTPLREQLLG
jgi:NTE family protein